jgi:tRNA(fMet)-specific endonuclease VapC
MDTNIITAIMKSNEKVKRRAQETILLGDDIFINGVSYYEIKRGLLAKDARKQLQFFDQLCKEYGLVLLDNQAIFDRAAEIYAELQRKGELIGDADILIAAITDTRNFTLVSDDGDFDKIPGLRVENWLR